MSDAAPQRRTSDRALNALAGEFRELRKEVGQIRDMLISEPEASPLGRTMLKYAADNRKLIDQLRADLEPIDDWWQQWRGVWRFVLGLGVVLGIVGSFFGVVAFFLSRT